MAKKKTPGSDDVTEFNLDLDEEELESPPLERGGGGISSGEADLVAEGVAVASDLPVQLTCVLGSKKFSLKELMEFQTGKVINLERAPNEIVDLVANGKMVARGELVEIDGKLGVRIIKMTK